MAIAEIQNSIFTIQECSIHEHGNRNEIVHKFEVIFYYHYSIYGNVQSGSSEFPISSSPSDPLYFNLWCLMEEYKFHYTPKIIM